MKFGRVQGHGRAVMVHNATMVALAVVLDSGNTASVVRDEQVPWLEYGPEHDIAWQIDQYTQETIGTMLALDGWEAFAEDQGGLGVSDDGLAHSAVYTVRNLSTPVVTWDDLK